MGPEERLQSEGGREMCAPALPALFVRCHFTGIHFLFGFVLWEDVCEYMAWDYTFIVCHESLVSVGQCGGVQPMLYHREALGASISTSNDQLMTTEIS